MCEILRERVFAEVGSNGRSSVELVPLNGGAQNGAFIKHATDERWDFAKIAVREADPVPFNVVTETSPRGCNERDSMVKGTPHERRTTPPILADVIWEHHNRRISKLGVQR